MFDAKKLLDQFLGSQVPGAGGSVRDRAGQLGQMAKDNPLATGAIAAVLLGTSTGRQLGGSALKLGGLAAIAGLGYQAKDFSAVIQLLRGRLGELGPVAGRVEPDRPGSAGSDLR